MVEVFLSLAVICFGGQCHPALVGKKTQPGVYPMHHVAFSRPGYGGDVLAFREVSPGTWQAIHRVWTLRPAQRRLERLASPDASQRQGITDGCINIAPATYDALVACCLGQPLHIYD